ncbi:MAG: hypothetical protein P4M09_21210 [Devosia sp.]|nr:hypothetical protein [Devosia sp.]
MTRYIPDIALRALSYDQLIKLNADALSLEDDEAVVDEMMQPFADFIEDQRLLRAANWFDGISVDLKSRRWTDAKTGISGVGAISFVMHGFGVDADTAEGLLRLAAQQDCDIKPNTAAGHFSALQLVFPEESL